METDEPQGPDPIVVLARLIEWQRAMGVDASVAATAVDWLARGDSPPAAGFTPRPPAQASAPGSQPAVRAPAPAVGPVSQPPAATKPRPSMPPPTRARSASAADGRSAVPAAVDAPTLEALRTSIEQFDGCGLKTTAKSLCFYRGAPTARLMIIGEAPGRDEDLAGKPFVGRAGQLLDRMLQAIGLSEADVHITNTVYWRPPGNRQPTPQELIACRPFLERQIDLVAPSVLVLMGGVAASHMLDTTIGITKLRGKWTSLDRPSGALPALPTLHPAYLLRSPVAKRQAWHDLRLIKAALAAS